MVNLILFFFFQLEKLKTEESLLKELADLAIS
jgi:hypothetical protein